MVTCPFKGLEFIPTPWHKDLEWVYPAWLVNTEIENQGPGIKEEKHEPAVRVNTVEITHRLWH